jgi:hypothetical protein
MADVDCRRRWPGVEAPDLSSGDRDRPGGDDPRSELGPVDTLLGVPWREKFDDPVISELALGRRPADCQCRYSDPLAMDWSLTSLGWSQGILV